MIMAQLILSDTVVANTDWIWQFEFRDDETDDLIDFTGAEIEVDISDFDGCRRISSSVTNGNITIPALGTIQLAIPYTQTCVLPGSYKVGGIYRLNDETISLLTGSISVIASGARL